MKPLTGKLKITSNDSLDRMLFFLILNLKPRSFLILSRYFCSKTIQRKELLRHSIHT
jgi:hypothetical protein